MYAELLDEAADIARETGVRACWRQWVALGSYAMPVAERRARAIVDIEALLLLTLALRRHEPRLGDYVAWWARTASHLSSVQRLRSLADLYPGDRGRRLFVEFASLEHESGDRRWRRYAEADARPESRPAKGPADLDLADPATLQVRLRAGLGVGAKADVLAFLIGRRGERATVRRIAEAVAYTHTAVRAAAADMALGRLIREVRGHPTEYAAPARGWAELLELTTFEGPEAGSPRAPPWRFWGRLFPFLDGVREWVREYEENPTGGEHVVASRARDVVERHARAFELNGIPVPLPADYKGRRFPVAFRDTVRAVADWLEENL